MGTIKLTAAGIDINDVKEKEALSISFVGLDGDKLEVIIDEEEIVFLSLDRDAIPKLEKIKDTLSTLIERSKKI